MKQSVSPGVFIGIIVVVVAVVGLFMWKTWTGPSASPAAGANVKFDPRKEGGHGPTPDQQTQIKAWKQAHPHGLSGQ